MVKQGKLNLRISDALSRLYRRRFSRANAHLAAFFKICKICILLRLFFQVFSIWASSFCIFVIQSGNTKVGLHPGDGLRRVAGRRGPGRGPGPPGCRSLLGLTLSVGAKLRALGFRARERSPAWRQHAGTGTSEHAGTRPEGLPQLKGYPNGSAENLLWPAFRCIVSPAKAGLRGMVPVDVAGTRRIVETSGFSGIKF